MYIKEQEFFPLNTSSQQDGGPTAKFTKAIQSSECKIQSFKKRIHELKERIASDLDEFNELRELEIFPTKYTKFTKAIQSSEKEISYY